MSLQQAPAHVVLAVDLIELLEKNQIDAKVVLAALPLIERDYQSKLHSQVHNLTAGHSSKEP